MAHLLPKGPPYYRPQSVVSVQSQDAMRQLPPSTNTLHRVGHKAIFLSH